jgi:hypothetical protein
MGRFQFQFLLDPIHSPSRVHKKCNDSRNAAEALEVASTSNSKGLQSPLFVDSPAVEVSKGSRV